jgi:hypothetical protein
MNQLANTGKYVSAMVFKPESVPWHRKPWELWLLVGVKEWVEMLCCLFRAWDFFLLQKSRGLNFFEQRSINKMRWGAQMSIPFQFLCLFYLPLSSSCTLYPHRHWAFCFFPGEGGRVLCWPLAAGVEGWRLGFCGFVLGAAGGWLEGWRLGGCVLHWACFVAFFMCTTFGLVGGTWMAQYQI